MMIIYSVSLPPNNDVVNTLAVLKVGHVGNVEFVFLNQF